MRILFISSTSLDRIQHGGDQWSLNIVDSLGRLGHQVTIAGSGRSSRRAGGAAANVRKTETRTRKAPLRALYWGACAVVTGRPYSVQKWMSRGSRRELAALAREPWNVVMIFGANMGWAADLFSSQALIHISTEPGHILYRDLADKRSGLRRLPYRREARLLLRAESALVARSSEIWCISQVDAHHFSRLPGAAVRVLGPLCRSAWATADRSLSTSYDVVLLGNWLWQPNADALHWYLAHVLPRLPRHWRTGVGGAGSEEIQAPSPNVIMLGPVADACAFLLSGDRIAVPSRSIVGFNLKLLDAIAAARPVVTTIEALRLVGNVPAHVVVAADATAFGDALQVARDPVDFDVANWMIARQNALDEAICAGLSRILRR